MRNWAQRNCHRCGYNITHPEMVVPGGRCPVSDEAWEALKVFARENGRTWRAKLRGLWASGRDEGQLRILRNVLGPSQLDKVKL